MNRKRMWIVIKSIVQKRLPNRLMSANESTLIRFEPSTVAIKVEGWQLKWSVSNFSLRDWSYISFIFSLLFIALKVPDTRRNQRNTPKNNAGIYCRPLGFIEEDYEPNHRDFALVESNDYEHTGGNSIEINFSSGSNFNFFMDSFRSYRWQNFAESIACECIQGIQGKKSEIEIDPAQQDSHSFWNPDEREPFKRTWAICKCSKAKRCVIPFRFPCSVEHGSTNFRNQWKISRCIHSNDTSLLRISTFQLRQGEIFFSRSAKIQSVKYLIAYRNIYVYFLFIFRILYLTMKIRYLIIISKMWIEVIWIGFTLCRKKYEFFVFTELRFL